MEWLVKIQVVAIFRPPACGIGIAIFRPRARGIDMSDRRIDKSVSSYVSFANIYSLQRTHKMRDTHRFAAAIIALVSIARKRG